MCGIYWGDSNKIRHIKSKHKSINEVAKKYKSLTLTVEKGMI
jgi:hypothetical protein